MFHISDETSYTTEYKYVMKIYFFKSLWGWYITTLTLWAGSIKWAQPSRLLPEDGDSTVSETLFLNEKQGDG
jgi:hypothetical protein